MCGGGLARPVDMVSYDEDCFLEEDQLIAAMSAKQKARKKKKGTTKRQREKQGFKRSDPSKWVLSMQRIATNRRLHLMMGKTMCSMKITRLRKQGKLGIWANILDYILIMKIK